MAVLPRSGAGALREALHQKRKVFGGNDCIFFFFFCVPIILSVFVFVLFVGIILRSSDNCSSARGVVIFIIVIISIV